MGNCATIVIVDDQDLYREGLKALISQCPEFNVIGEASDGKEALEVCRGVKPDIVLMDIQMPVMDGVQATRLLLEEQPTIAVVMLTIASDD